MVASTVRSVSMLGEEGSGSEGRTGHIVAMANAAYIEVSFSCLPSL